VLDDLVVGLQGRGALQWRLALAPAQPTADATRVEANDHRSDLDLNRRLERNLPELAAHRLISQLRPRLPGRAPGSSRRWDSAGIWSPVETQPLCRHCQVDGPTRLVTNGRNPPAGFRREFDLGVTRTFALPGTQRLLYRAGTFELSDEQGTLPEGRSLGYIETVPLPGCEPLELCRLLDTGERVLLAGDADPLRGQAELIARLGWIEPFELPPRAEVLHQEPSGAVALHRIADADAGRHRYEISSSNREQPNVVLGSVLTGKGSDLVALRLRSDGRLATDLTSPGRATRDPRKLARWAAMAPAPEGTAFPWSRAGRARHLLRHWSGRRLSDDEGTTLGWLMREGQHGSRPLFSTTHPVTGDQLVTSNPSKAVGLGYLPDGLLGFVLDTVTEDSDRKP